MLSLWIHAGVRRLINPAAAGHTFFSDAVGVHAVPPVGKAWRQVCLVVLGISPSAPGRQTDTHT